MADAATARREARRRKILENSHNRLQLISGKNGNELCKDSPASTLIPDEIHEYSAKSSESSSSSKCILNNGVINAEPESLAFLSTSYENTALGDGDVSISNHELASLLPTATLEPTTPSQPFFERIISCKYDIVVISLLFQLFYSLSPKMFEETYFFLPLIVYVSTKLIWFPKQHNSNIANILLLLNGMSASRVQKMLSIAQWVSAFSQDVCVFLFITICIQSLCQVLKDNFM